MAARYPKFDWQAFNAWRQANPGLSGWNAPGQGTYTSGSGVDSMVYASAPLSETGGTYTFDGLHIAPLADEPGSWIVYENDPTLNGKAYKRNGQIVDKYDASGNFAGDYMLSGIDHASAEGQFLKALLVAIGGPLAGGAMVGAAGGGFGAGLGLGGAGGAGGLGAMDAAAMYGVEAGIGGMTAAEAAALGGAGVAGAGGAAGTAGAAGAVGAAGKVAAGAAGAGGLLSQVGGWAGLLAPAAQIVGGLLTNDAAGDAADAQVGAAREGIAEQRRQFDTVRELLKPYVDAGSGALGAYQRLAGLSGADKQAAEIAALKAGPQFGYLVDQGEDAILANAAATGGLRGGNTQHSLADWRAGVLSSLIDKQLGRYGGLINVGQNSAAGTGTAAMQTGQNVANLMQQAGAAEAGGIVAGNNAITNAIGSVGGFLAGRTASVPAPTTQYLNPSEFGGGTIPGGYGFQVRSF